MKNIFKLLSLAGVAMLVITACQKKQELTYYSEGTPVTLTASTNGVVASFGDSTSPVVDFNWTDPKYATDSSSYKFILEMDSAGRNFAKKTTKEIIGKLGTSLTGRELNAILLGYGFAPGTSHTMDFRVVSSYSNNNERYISNTVNVAATPYRDSSILTTANTTVTCALNTASQSSNSFSWTASFKGFSGAITYTLQYDSAGKNFTTPMEIAIGNDLYSKALNQGEMNETALSSGIAGGTTGKVEYRIKAATALGAVAYSNTVFVTINSYIPLLRFYLPGGYQGATGNGNDWDPGTAPEFIRDLRSGLLNNMYYLYIYLPAGAEFKVTQGRSWDVNYGGSAGTLSSGGANLSVANAGFYRISINRSTMQYDIRAGRMGFVGGATGAGWNPPNVFPNYALGAAATNLFVGLTDFTTDAWKLIDSDTWNNGSNAVDETRSYGSTGGSGSAMEINGANFPNITTAGRYRVIWDGRNVDAIKYEMSPATEMRVVGDGIQGVNAWDPGTSPQMNYLGNGQWQLTLDLVGGKDIKFLAGNAWGAFDYEDNSGGITATGVARKIKWEGGDNFKTPATSGTYTILLDENAQTVTIN
ncbi:MAG: hypothetical protein GC171_15945 [Terrimonas sp.]|nr:hypothetical protein [Terrimonas sp.]